MGFTMVPLERASHSQAAYSDHSAICKDLFAVFSGDFG